MPTDQLVILICCLVATLGAAAGGVLAWRRTGRRPLLATGIAWALVPIGLWLSGLADLLWRGIQGIIAWAVGVPTVPPAVPGLIVLGVAVVALVVIALIGQRRRPAAPSGRPSFGADRTAAAVDATASRPTATPASAPRPAASPVSGTPDLPPAAPPASSKRGSGGRSSGGRSSGGDEEMDEIEAILKSRGIE